MSDGSLVTPIKNNKQKNNDNNANENTDNNNIINDPKNTHYDVKENSINYLVDQAKLHDSSKGPI